MRPRDTLTAVVAALVATALVVVAVVVNAPDEERPPPPAPEVATDGTTSVEPPEQRPDPELLTGDDGWLYLRKPVVEACDDGAPVAGVLAEVRRTARVAAAADLRFVALVPPDKAAVFPEPLLERFESLVGCLQQRATELTDGAGPDVPLLTGYEPLRAAALDGGEIRGELAYHRRDSHWRAAAALELSLQLHQLLSPSTAARLEAVPGELHDRPQDLERFATGRVIEDSERLWSLAEPGTTTQRRDPVPAVEGTVGREVTGGSQPFDHLVVVRDSFGELMLDQLAPLATTSHFCRCSCECLPAALGPSLERADVLVWQNVQRGAHRRMVGGRLAGQLATLLGDRLPTTPLDVDGSTVVAPPDGVLRLQFVDGPPDTVTVTDADGRSHVLTTKGGTLPSLLLDEVATGPVTVSSGGQLVAAEHASLEG